MIRCLSLSRQEQKSIPPHKENMNRVIEYRVAFLKQSGIEIQYGINVDQNYLDTEKPDIVILATGSVPAIPGIKGIDSKSVYIADDVLRGKEVVGDRIAVLGAGLIGAETAEYLAAKNKQVEIFDLIGDIAPDFNKARRWFLLKRLAEGGVKKHMKVRISEIDLPSITAVNEEGREEIFDGFDAMIIAAGRKENNGLSKIIQEQYPDIKLCVIGDARKADTAIEAIADAAITAANL